MEKILLHETLGKFIVTRNAVIKLFDSLASLNEGIVLDFTNIEFISRSSAHEYIRQKITMNKKIDEVNMSKNVKAMFALVARQIKKVAA